jgi:hypothetical protein
MGIHFLSLVSLLSLGSCHNNRCPVTSRYQVSKNGYLPFPSFYWPDKPKPEPGEEFYNCSIPVYRNQSIIGTCMPQRPCLVSQEIIHAALEPQKWSASMNAICSLEEQISLSSDKNHSYPRHSLNLIIIGGSMTKGSETDGKCLCIRSEDSNCPHTSRGGISFCSWVTHFVNWVRAEFPMIQFNVSDLSRGGLASFSVPDFVDPFLRRFTLSDNDIIIIDESVNDATSGRSFATLKGDVEMMIRRLFISAKGSFPTIIMIEQFPHGSQLDVNSLPQHNNSKKVVISEDYTIIYRSLSQHYQFPLFSLRDVYWTFFNHKIAKSRRYPFSPYDDWHVHTHPPWYFHNFMADVIADCFLHSLSRCRDKRESGSTRIHARYTILLPTITAQTRT